MKLLSDDSRLYLGDWTLTRTILIGILTLVTLTAMSFESRVSAQKSGQWIKNKFEISLDTFYINKNKTHLVLKYIVTNKTGRDITLEWKEKRLGDEILRQSSRVSVFLKDKKTSSLSEVKWNSSFLGLFKTFLPKGMTVDFYIFVKIPSSAKPAWYSFETMDARDILQRTLGGKESIIILVPNKRYKLTFPIPNAADR